MYKFFQACQKIEVESSKLRKIEILSQYINEFSEDEEQLYLFCQYICGNIFPKSAFQNINVGSSIITKAIIKTLNLDPNVWAKTFNETREIGKTAERLFKQYKESKNLENIKNTEFSLTNFRDLCQELISNSKSTSKIEILKVFFDKLDGLGAKYVSRLLSGNLRIGVQEALVEEAIAKSFFLNKKSIQKANFYLGDIGKVATLAKNKNLKEVQFSLFHPIKPMLASACNNVDDVFQKIDEEVWAEYKYDGIRAQLHKEGEKVRIFSRDLKDITSQFPEVESFFSKIRSVDSLLLDGEIVPYQEGKILPFAYIQKRLGRKDNIDREATNNPTVFIAYDCLLVNGVALFEEPLHKRRRILEDYSSKAGIHLSEKKVIKTKEEFILFFRKSKEEGREGLMIKRPESTYEAGKRGLNWMKYKEVLETLDVVIMKAMYGEGKKSKFLSIFLVGVLDDTTDKIVPIGRVSSGASEDELKKLHKLVLSHQIAPTDNGYEVEPSIVIEIAYENIQTSDRYESGYALRFPRIVRIRLDKSVHEINCIEDVKRIYASIVSNSNTVQPSQEN